VPIAQLKTQIENPFKTRIGTVAAPRTAALALALALAAAGPAQTAEPAKTADTYLSIVDAEVAYAADFVMANKKTRIKGRIVHRPGVTRTEFGRTVIVHDLKQERWVQFLPGQKQYLSLSSRGQAKAVYLPPGVKRAELRAERLGSETVAGEKTQKIKLSFPNGVLTVWQTMDGIVVKMEGTATVHKRTQTVTMAMQNLKRGPQDPALFLPPPGSTQLNAPVPKKAPKKK
jgi:hypothetical protein